MAQNEYLVDGADMTTVADAIRERGGTTAPLSFPAGMAEAVRNIQSGADLSLGITGAQVEQIAKITAVDETGKPTAWEAVEMANGEEPWDWELINEVTIPDGSGEVEKLTIDVDSNGKPFKLHRFMLFGSYPKYTGESEIPRFGYGEINGYRYNTPTNVSPLVYTALPEPSKTTPMSFSWMEGDVFGSGNYLCILGNSNSSPLDNGRLSVESGTGLAAASRFRYITAHPQSLFDIYRPIKSVGLTYIRLFPGCKFALYGTRVKEDTV